MTSLMYDVIFSICGGVCFVWDCGVLLPHYLPNSQKNDVRCEYTRCLVEIASVDCVSNGRKNDVRCEYARGAPEPSLLQIPIDI